MAEISEGLGAGHGQCFHRVSRGGQPGLAHDFKPKFSTKSDSTQICCRRKGKGGAKGKSPEGGGTSAAGGGLQLPDGPRLPATAAIPPPPPRQWGGWDEAENPPPPPLPHYRQVTHW